MPQPGRRWFHVILNTRGSWLPGDPRGFRSRDHRLHSSGDYKHRPPLGEHERLYRYQQQRSRSAVSLPAELWPRIGETILAKLRTQGHEVLVLSVDHHHVHLLAKLPGDYAAAKRYAGILKQHSSRAVRDVLPGRIWADGGKPIPIRDRAHQLNVYRYILRHAQQGAWTWSFKETAAAGD